MGWPNHCRFGIGDGAWNSNPLHGEEMKSSRAFTLIELLTVIAIIVVLMSLVISVAGFVQDKASRDRSSAEIAAFSAAMESYKADNGIYPQTDETDKLDPKTHKDPKDPAYIAASLALYKELSGDLNADFKRTDEERDGKVYFEFETKKSMVMLTADKKTVLGLMDPWGNSYGYSTIYVKQLQEGDPNSPTGGYNPTFDLWSTANKGTNEEAWIKNW